MHWKIYIIRSQEKNSNLGPPDFWPGALSLELSWFSCQFIPKSPSWVNYCNSNCNSSESIFIFPITENVLLSISNYLESNDSPENDRISSNVITLIISPISKPLAFAFNFCLSEGIFPDELKYATVTHKTSDRNNLKY